MIPTSIEQEPRFLIYMRQIVTWALCCLSCFVDREYDSLIGSCFMTILIVICSLTSMVFNGLSCFGSLAFDILNPPSRVNFLDHEILNNS